ncbi:unnamed protein product [Closterium sp. NIES-53]
MVSEQLARRPLAARAPPLAARSLPLAARSPPLQPAHHPLAACLPPLAACAPPSGSPLAAPLQLALLLATLAVRRPALPVCCSVGSVPPCSARYGFSSCPHVLSRGPSDPVRHVARRFTAVPTERL